MVLYFICILHTQGEFVAFGDGKQQSSNMKKQVNPLKKFSSLYNIMYVQSLKYEGNEQYHKVFQMTKHSEGQGNQLRKHKQKPSLFKKFLEVRTSKLKLLNYLNLHID